MQNNLKIGFIGAGVMGKAIIKGLINSNFIESKNITASEVTQESADKVSEEIGIKTFINNKELVKSSDIIILSVKPYVIKDILSSVKDDLTKDKAIISIAAGISTEFIESTIDEKISVTRAMPNTPALIEEGMTALCRGKYTSDKDINLAHDLFSSIGRCIEVQEKFINAVTGISGSGPAFVYFMIEALADGGLKLGLPKKTAIELAAQTLLGASKMVLETGKHPSMLKDEVTTPGGTTIAGLAVMEENKIHSALMKTVEETAITASKSG